ncbi:MAG: hypothetical protein V4754_03815 [Pseudomonadota bacterium]
MKPCYFLMHTFARFTISVIGLTGSFLYSAVSFGSNINKQNTQEHLGWRFNDSNEFYFGTPEAACKTSYWFDDPNHVFIRTEPESGREFVRQCLWDYRDRKPGDLGPWAGIGYAVDTWADTCDQGFTWNAELRICSFNFPKPDFCQANTPHPILLAGGKKHLDEIIYQGVGAFPLKFSIHYDSEERLPNVSHLAGVNFTGDIHTTSTGISSPCRPNYGNSSDSARNTCASPRTPGAPVASPAIASGIGWRHEGQRGITAISNETAAVVRSNNSTYRFNLVNGAWLGDAAAIGSLVKLSDGSGQLLGWNYTATDDNIERYDAAGRLRSITTRMGFKHTYEYDSLSRLNSIADGFGHKITFSFDEQGRIFTFTDPAQQTTKFGYDEKNNLSTLTFPGGAIKSFLYENVQFPNAMTGTVDENGKRTMTYSYDTQGRAYDEVGPNGVDHYNLVFNSDATLETDPLNTQRTVTFADIAGTRKVVAQSQPAGAGCVASSSSMKYDGNGNIKSRTNFNNITTTYTFDLIRNLEMSRLEAVGTPQARTITTIWHATYRLPRKVFEPLRLTTYDYGPTGNLLSRAEQATLDVNGSKGIDAVLSGTARKWTYTYYPNGQLWTVKGPGTDIVDVSTYTYDVEGNFASITNAVGQLTTLKNYDANGRVGTIIDPNNIVTTMTYWPRGWLKSRTVTAGGVAQTTAYDYDGVGQLKLVTLPDASSVTYSYDDAHRLTGVADSLGNNITYTLDNIGNRRKTEVKDPNGLLARQTTRDIDALNRVKQLTGAQQ